MSKQHKHIIFIAPTSSQPRYHKRVEQLSQFARVTIFAFQRQLYKENTFNKDYIYYSLGEILDGNYHQRLLKLTAAIYKVRNYVKRFKDVEYYAMSMDCLLIAKLAGIKTGYYEVGDLRTAENIGRFFGILENQLFKDIKGLVLTSRFFYEEFYKQRKNILANSVYIIDNKLNSVFRNKRPTQKKITANIIKIGLIGLLRYNKPIKYLLRFVTEHPDKFAIECYGDGPSLSSVKSYLSDNIRYYGSFKNPDDLEKIYTSVDVNFVVYDSTSKNVRLAIPNKLFESAFFRVPLLSATKTSLGQVAQEWGIGKTIRLENYQEFSEDMIAINQEWILNAQNNCNKIDEKELLDDGELVLRQMICQ